MRTVIAEDSMLFREGLARLLTDADHEIVAAVGDAPGLVAAVHRTRPDLAIVDIHMPPHRGADGAVAARNLRADHPDLGIVLLSQHIEVHATVDLVTAGGFGYLLKDRVFDVEEFLDALRRVAAGGSALDPEVVAQLIGHRRREDPLARLTDPDHLPHRPPDLRPGGARTAVRTRRSRAAAAPEWAQPGRRRRGRGGCRRRTGARPAATSAGRPTPR